MLRALRKQKVFALMQSKLKRNCSIINILTSRLGGFSAHTSMFLKMICYRIRMNFSELLPENIQIIHVVIHAKTKTRKILHFF